MGLLLICLVLPLVGQAPAGGQGAQQGGQGAQQGGQSAQQGGQSAQQGNQTAASQSVAAEGKLACWTPSAAAQSAAATLAADELAAKSTAGSAAAKTAAAALPADRLAAAKSPDYRSYIDWRYGTVKQGYLAKLIALLDGDKLLAEAQTPALVQSSSAGASGTPSYFLATTRAVLLQLVTWTNQGEVLAATWYAYDESAPKQEAADRILGEKAVTIVTISLGSDTLNRDGTEPGGNAWTNTGCVAGTPLTYKVSAAPYTSTLLQQLGSAVSSVGGVLGAPKEPLLAPPKPNASGVQAAITTGIPVLAPSNLEVVTLTGASSPGTTVSDQKFVDEKLYWLGLSFPVAINSFKDVTWNSTASTALPTSQQRTNVYGAIDFYPLKTDLSSAKAWPPYPHLLFALPISGQPLEHWMAGVALPVYITELYAGVVFNKEQDPVAGTLETRWVKKLAFGINVPVSQISSVISSATSGSK